jgi:hypothetical protein
MAGPWFETSWFKGVVALSGAALLVGAYQLYNHQAGSHSGRREAKSPPIWLPTNATVIGQEVYPNGFDLRIPNLPQERVVSVIHLIVVNTRPVLSSIPIEFDPGDGAFHETELLRLQGTDEFDLPVTQGYGPISHRPVIRLTQGSRTTTLGPTKLVELPPSHQIIDQTSVRPDPRIQARRTGPTSVTLTVKAKEVMKQDDEFHVTGWTYLNPARPLATCVFSPSGTCVIENSYASEQRNLAVQVDHNPPQSIDLQGTIEGSKLETYSDGSVLEILHSLSLRQGPWEFRIPVQSRATRSIRIMTSFSIRVELYYEGKKIPYFLLRGHPGPPVKMRPMALIASPTPQKARSIKVAYTERPSIPAAESWRSDGDLPIRFDAETLSFQAEKESGISIQYALPSFAPAYRDAPEHAKIDAHDSTDFGPITVHIKGKAYVPVLLWTARIPVEQGDKDYSAGRYHE